MKVVEEMVKSTDSTLLRQNSSEAKRFSSKELNGRLSSRASVPMSVVRGSGSTSNEDTISINKNILPFFSIPVILKKISDQKKNINLNLLNPQKKLVYKIIKLNTKLVEFTTNIKKYNFNLNSFKGNNLDFILFIKNNLYYNLKYRLSNISYKIEKFLPFFKINSLLNNINLFSPKRLLKPQPYIRFSYKLKGYSKISVISMQRLSAPQQMAAHSLVNQINARAINYLLVKLNNLENEIEYIINIKNKFIKLIKFLKIMNIKSGLDQSLVEDRNKANLVNNSSEENRWEIYLNSLKTSVKSNPVDILYFNNNLNRPIINQYLK